MSHDATNFSTTPLELSIEDSAASIFEILRQAAEQPSSPPAAEPPAPVSKRRVVSARTTPAAPIQTKGSVAAAMFLQLRSECEELRRRMAMVPRATQSAAIQIAELEKALLSIRKARDTTLTQMQELANKLRETELRSEELVQEHEATQHAADVAGASLEATRQENEELRALLQAKDDEHAAALRDLESRVQTEQPLPMSASTHKLMTAQLATARVRISSLETRFEVAQQQHKESVATIVENLIRAERGQHQADELAQHLQAQVNELVAERNQYYEALVASHAQLTELQAEAARIHEDQDAAVQIELQRQQIAELSAQLNAARDEVRLAWSVNRVTGTPGESVVEVPEAPFPEELESFDDQNASLLVADMEQTFLLAAGASDPVEMLGVLGAQVKDFAQRMLGTGSLSSYRVLGVCTEVVEWMQKSPSKVASMQPTMLEAFRLLGRVAACADPAVHGDTNEASVYVVDDDLDNCDCIAMSLDRIGLRTHYASKPDLAVEHLIAETADLIFLDVDLGSTNGFEVHGRVRQIPHHRDTPVLFVSGMSSARQQVDQLGSGKNDFMHKPYSLSELRLKALCMIIASRLSAVA